jgi:hypothetical protein
VTTSQTPFLAEIADQFAPIPPGKLAYLETRVAHAFHNYILEKFEEKKKTGLTNAILAKRIGRDAGQVHRYLATPCNLTLHTATLLLAGIAAEELLPHSQSLLDRAPRNFSAYDPLGKPEGAPVTLPSSSTGSHASTSVLGGKLDPSPFKGISAS